MIKIAMYGAGFEGEKFYCRWKDEYDIKFVIDKNNRICFTWIQKKQRVYLVK